MALEFGQIEPAQLGQASRFDIPLNEWVGVQFAGGQNSQLGPRLTSFLGESLDPSPSLSPEEANAQFGIPGHLRFDAPVKAERAQEMKDRKDAELKYAAYHESALHSWFSPKAAIGQLAAFAGGSTHPVDFLVNFLPFVGEEAKAVQMAEAGAGVFRQGVARGLITAETIGKLPLLSKFPNYSRALIDATIGNAVLEIPNFYLARRNQEDYDPNDLAGNILAGGSAGGTIAHGIKSLFHLAHFGYERLHGPTRDAMNSDSMTEHLSGESRPIEQRAAVDEQAIRDAYAFNEDLERANIIKELQGGTKPVSAALDDLDAIESAAFGAPAKTELPSWTREEMIRRGLDPNRPLNDVDLENKSVRDAIGSDPTLSQEQKALLLKTGSPVRPVDIKQDMARRVEAILKERKAEAQRMVEGKISEAKAKVLKTNIERSRTMSDEQVKKFAAPMDPAEKQAFHEADAAAKNDVATEATKSLEDYADRLDKEAKDLEAAGKEDEAAAKMASAEQVREELKAQMDAIKEVPDKAIDAIGPCITGL